MQLISKLPDVGTTIFTTMSKLAAEHNAINLGQGFPDFNPDQKLLKLVNDAMQAGYNQYPYMPGVSSLREVISRKVQTLYGCNYDPETEITITSGATEAIMASVMASVQHGDEVLVIEPNYDSYLPAIRLAGGKPVPVAMDPPSTPADTFKVNWDKVAKAVSEKTRLIMLNFPHNPTGAVLSENDLDQLEKIVNGTNILVLSDEVYEHITFVPQGHLSVSSRPNLAARSFVISSFGKTTHTTGWKIGYCCAPIEMTRELRKVHQFFVFTVASPFQHALAEYTKDPNTYLNLPAFYQSKRDRLVAGLRETRFIPYACPGTYFLLASYDQISKKSESDFSQWLTTQHGVTVIPVSAFYSKPDASESNHHLVRFCFAKTEHTIDAAIEKLRHI